MSGVSIFRFPLLSEGILLKRYKRFLADVRLDSGDVVTAHCPNTGPMSGVLFQGGRVRLRYAPSPTRKLEWTWEQAQVHGEQGTPCWVGVNTAMPNKLIKLAIEKGFLLDELGHIDQIKEEVVYGTNRKSRIDLLVIPAKENSDLRLIYIEVKNTTWANNGIGLFPDSVTLRGQKHLRELISLVPQYRPILVPCISREDIISFAPGDKADPKYGELYKNALSAGVDIIPCCFGFHQDHITWEGKRPFLK